MTSTIFQINETKRWHGKNPHILEFFPFLVQCLHLHRQFGLGLTQFLFLGGDNLDDAVVDIEGTNPLTETLARLGSILHQ
jgi:hypothetical protein